MTTPNLMEHLPEIARRIEHQESVFLGLDFDGTLTPIRPHPEEAILADSVRDILARLARLPQVTVMVISGRALADVAGRVGLPEVTYAGDHGLQIHGPGLDFTEPAAAALVDQLRDLVMSVQERLKDIPGVRVEMKHLTASVHYRNVARDLWDELERAVKAVVAMNATRFGLSAGLRIWEIKPKVAWHKGEALRSIMQHVGGPPRRLLLYLGDDRTDEDAFAAFPEAVTVKVGERQTSTAARFTLPGPDSVAVFLRWLADQLSARPKNPKPV